MDSSNADSHGKSEPTFMIYIDVFSSNYDGFTDDSSRKTAFIASTSPNRPGSPDEPAFLADPFFSSTKDFYRNRNRKVATALTDVPS